MNITFCVDFEKYINNEILSSIANVLKVGFSHQNKSMNTWLFYNKQAEYITNTYKFNIYKHDNIISKDQFDQLISYVESGLPIEIAYSLVGGTLK